MSNCPFCHEDIKREIILESDLCAFIPTPSEVLEGSGMIITKAHRETVFDMTKEEMNDLYDLLHKVKVHLDDKYRPHGYNLGWNCEKTGGQTVPHVHLHVIPRFKDEPLANKGIRHH